MLKCIVCIGLLSGIICLGLGKSHDENRIIGGHLVDIKQVPYHVSLQYFKKHICGGSIIGVRHVVTAAHCVDSLFPYALRVRHGSSSHMLGGDTIEVSKVYQHHNYSIETQDFDIAVLELASDLKFSKTTQPILLDDGSIHISEGLSAHISGWGRTSSNGWLSLLLRYAAVQIVSDYKCQEAYIDEQVITERMLCAAGEGKDSCQGDSGGPLVGNNTLVGIISWGRKCADPKYPGVYSRVSKLRLFIHDVSGI